MLHDPRKSDFSYLPAWSLLGRRTFAPLVRKSEPFPGPRERGLLPWTETARSDRKRECPARGPRAGHLRSIGALCSQSMPAGAMVPCRALDAADSAAAAPLRAFATATQLRVALGDVARLAVSFRSRNRAGLAQTIPQRWRDVGFGDEPCVLAGVTFVGGVKRAAAYLPKIQVDGVRLEPRSGLHHGDLPKLVVGEALKRSNHLLDLCSGACPRLSCAGRAGGSHRLDIRIQRVTHAVGVLVVILRFRLRKRAIGLPPACDLRLHARCRSRSMSVTMVWLVTQTVGPRDELDADPRVCPGPTSKRLSRSRWVRS